MLFKTCFHEAIRRREITCTVRIWQRPRVRVGNRYRLGGGSIEVLRIQEIGFEDPGERAAELAARLQRPRDEFKQDVRKLKALGLTISLEVGYRLSPRGAALVAAKTASKLHTPPLRKNRNLE